MTSNDWIAVEDGLPEDLLEVVATDGIHMGTASLFGDLWLWSTKGLGDDPVEITHWQYLPDLPGGAHES